MDPNLPLQATLDPASLAVRQADQIRAEMAERFNAYDEIRQLAPSTREALFRVLLRAQEGDTSVIRDLYGLVYEEIPVDFDQFVESRRYLGLRHRIDPVKFDLLRLYVQPNVRKFWVAAGKGSGKDLAELTPLPTPSGWTTMGAVTVGDLLLDEQGRPCRVVATSETFYHDCYRVTFDDGTSIVAGAGHEWQVIDWSMRRRLQRRDGRAHRQPPLTDWREHWSASRVVTTREMAMQPRVGAYQRRWMIPCAKPIVGASKDLPVDPYALGVWLGNGGTDSAVITLRTEDCAPVTETLVSVGADLRERESQRRSGSRAYGWLHVLPALRRLGVLGRKHIPTPYLRAPLNVRQQLLQGLMDTDGFVVRPGCGEVEIDLTCEELALGVLELVRSCGWKARQTERLAKFNGREYGTCWRCRFTPDRSVFRAAERRAAWRADAGQRSRHTGRWVVSVEPVPSVPTRCVQVDSPSHLYLAGESFIPTHNSFMVSVIQAWEVYNLLCLKRPDLFYMLGAGSKIATVNLSVAKEQAKDVVFSEFLGRLSHAPWFAGKYQPQTHRCVFPKNVFALSGGSGAVSYFGYNTKMGCVDEASFLLDREGRSLAEELTEALIGSLATRFPSSYKLMVISTLRADDDYLYKHIQRVKEDGTPLALRPAST